MIYKILLFIFTILFNSISYAGDINFCGNSTITSMEADIKSTDDCCLKDYLINKYGVSNYKTSSQFKFKVCGAAVHDCYYSKNDKYFITNIPNVNKWGEFYFGLLYTKQVSALIHSVA